MHQKKIFNFTKDINPVGTSTKVKNKLRKALKHINTYNESAYIQFVNYLKKIHDVSEHNILIGHGLTYILKGILNKIRPKSVLLPQPTNHHYRFFLEDLKIETIMFYNGFLNEKFYDFKELIKIFDKGDLIILPNPHYLTGKMIEHGRLEELIEISENKKKFIIIDESLIDYTDRHSEVKKVASSNFVLILRTFSTFYALSGIPFGYAIAGAKTISTFKNFFGYEFDSITELAYIGATTALKDKHYKKRTTEYLKNEKIYIKERLKQIKNIEVFDSGCNFVLLMVNYNDKMLEDAFKKKNILVEKYNLPEGQFIRFPIQKHKYNAYFVKSLKHILLEKEIDEKGP